MGKRLQVLKKIFLAGGTVLFCEENMDRDQLLFSYFFPHDPSVLYLAATIRVLPTLVFYGVCLFFLHLHRHFHGIWRVLSSDWIVSQMSFKYAT